MSLDVEAFEMYWQAITILEARESLVDMTISDHPYLSKDKRSKLHRDMHKQAFPVVHDPNKDYSTYDFAKFLGGLGSTNGQ